MNTVFLVVVRWFDNIDDTVCVVTETEEKAREWIAKEMEGKEYSGYGVYTVVPVELYN